ncbi:hypothetical protein [Rathayibacter soli]|uniref:hypothetical protein n=1 Tax=Rathayibacter soli TaxID=3144168 RepID=UPI0027E5AA9C|nr:hypothetical protein [Glaciibacter superstes]
MLIHPASTWLLTLSLFMSGVTFAGPMAAGPGGGGCDADPFSPTCDVSINSAGGAIPPAANPVGAEGPPDGFAPGPQTCSYLGAAVPCADAAGSWSDNGDCHGYVSLAATQGAPPPGRDAAVGAWYQCTGYCPPPQRDCYNASFWSDTPPAGVIRYTPAQAAALLVRTFQLRGIDIGMAPAQKVHSDDPVGTVPYRRTWVGIPVWLWVDNPQPLSFGPYTQTATLGGVTVTATAQVASVTWSSGDGQAVTCGVGTVFNLDAMRDQLAVDSPTCGYRYQNTSGGGQFTATATSHWSVHWTGGGTDGMIAVRDTSSTTLVRVGELQSVNTDLADSLG